MELAYNVTDSVRNRNWLSLVLLAKQMWAQVKKRNARSELIRECIFRSGFNTILELAVVGETYHSYKLQRSFKRYRT